MSVVNVPQKRKAPRSYAIPIRLSRTEIALIERAAKLVGENRAEFVRGTAKRRALEILASAELHLLAGESAEQGE